MDTSSSQCKICHKYGRKHSFHWPHLTSLYPQFSMDSQDSSFTTPPPRIYGLYDINTPPSAQPRSPPFEIPESQQTTQSWDSRNGPRPQINESQQTTQSWDSRDGPRPITPTQSPLLDGSNNSFSTRAPETSRDKRLQIQTALLFKVPIAQIKETLNVTSYQIWYAKTHRLTPQKDKTGRHPKLYTPEKVILKN